MSLKDLLVRVKLIEDDPEPSSSVATDSGRETSPELVLEIEPSRTNLAVPAGAGEASGVTENTPFETLYASAGVPSSHFPAERLLKVLDGLRAMDATNRRAAVAAMDAADDTWSVEDILEDAARKVSALQAHVAQLNAAVASVQEQERSRKAELTRDYDALRASISEQIAQLEEAAQLAAAEHAQAVSALEAKTAAAVSAGQREQLRIQSEIERLNGISQQVDRIKI